MMYLVRKISEPAANIQSVVASAIAVQMAATDVPTSPTAKNLPSRLIDRQVAALILSLLVHVLEL